MAATSSGDRKGGLHPMAAVSLDKPTMEEVLERLLDAKFSRIETRLSALERQNEALIKASNEEENKSNQVLKAVNTRFSEISSQVAKVSLGVTKHGNASTPGGSDANTIPRLEGLEKGLKAISEDKRALEMMTSLDKKVTAMSSKLTFMDTKVNKLALIETKVSKLPSIEEKTAQMNASLLQLTSLPHPVNTSYPPPPLPMSALNARNTEEGLRHLIENKFKELPTILGTTELQAMAPKVQQLQSNLEVLLTGESEANALIDKLLPTVSDLKRDLDVLKTSQGQQFRTITQDLFPKVDSAVSDCYAKLQSVYDKASDAKGYAKDAADLAEDANEKLNKVQKTLASSGVSVVSSTSDHHQKKRKSSSILAGPSISGGAMGGPSRSRSHSLDGEDRIPAEQISRLQASVEQLKKEIRKVDVMDLVEERLIPNVLTIRKNIDILMQKNHLEVGGGGGVVGGGCSSGGGSGSRDRGSRPQFRSGHDPPTMSGPRGGFRGRGAPGFRRSTARRFIPGTKWTYDERGVREQDSDEEIEFRGSPKSRSRTRSRSPARSNSRPRRRLSEDENNDDSDDGEIVIMERQIGKIWSAVESIQTKMDSCLKHSKKSAIKGDENMEITLKKLSSINGAVEALRDTTEDEFKNVMEKVRSEEESPRKVSTLLRQEMAMADRVGLDEIRSLFKNLELKVDAKYNEYYGAMEATSDQHRAQIKEVLQEVKKVDVVIERTKALRKSTTDYSQTGLQMAALLKKIESNTAKLPSVDSSSSSSSDSSLVLQLKEIQPKLDYLYVKILPTLEDLKKAFRKSVPSQMSDMEELAKLEQRQLLQKIADGIQEVKELNKANKKQDQVGLAPIHENSIMQLYNAINELKNKEQNHFKMTSEIKTETLKMSKLLTDPARVKSQEKQISKTFLGVEELKKSSASDGKTLSQMNTVLQGLKASTSAQEAKVSNLLRELKEQILGIRTDVQESITDFKSEQFGANDELKNLVQMVEQPKDHSAIENARKLEMEQILKEVRDTVGTIIQSAAKPDPDREEAMNRTLKAGVSEIEESLKEFLDGMKANYEEHCAEIQGHCQGVEIKLSTLNSPAPMTSESQTIGTKANSASGNKALKSAQFEYNSLLEDLNDKVDDLGKDNLKGFQELADEMNKFKGVSSEILNSVEDMKQLASSMPNALHDLVPKIEQIAKEVHEIPNATLGNNACLEENLCANLDKLIKEEHEKTMTKISDKFETMDHRLAVIRKYAKHGPAVGSGGLTNSQDSPSPHVAPGGSVDPPHSASSLDRVMSHISLECQRLAASPASQSESMAHFNTAMDRLLPMVEDIHAMDKQLIQDMAREAVIEDQMQVVADTILQEFNKMPPVLDKMVFLLENDFHSLVEQSLVQASTSNSTSSGKSGPGNPNAGALLSIMKTEEKLMAKQNECMAVLTEMQKANARHDENLRDIGEVKATVYNLSQDLSPAKTNEAVKKLVEYLKRVQNAQSQILERADRSIHFQTTLNDIFKKLVPTLEVIQNCLDEREGQNLDSGNLSKLCADLQEKISALDELESELSAPKTQTCEDLRELVQMIVKVLDRLLKDKDLVMTEEEPMVLVQETQLSPSPEWSAPKAVRNRNPPGVRKRKGRAPKEDPTKTRPGALTTASAKRKRGKLAGPTMAPKRGSVRTPRLNYSEEAEEEDEDAKMLVQPGQGQQTAESNLGPEAAEVSGPELGVVNDSVPDPNLVSRRRPSLSINMSPSTSSSAVVTPTVNKPKPRKRKSKVEPEMANRGSVLRTAEVRLRKSDVDIVLGENPTADAGVVLPPKRRPMPKSKALAALSGNPLATGVISEPGSMGANSVPSANAANSDISHKPSTSTRQSFS